MALALAAACLGAGITLDRPRRKIWGAILLLVMFGALVGAERLADKHYERLAVFAFFAVIAFGFAGWFFTKPMRTHSSSDADSLPDIFGEYGNANCSPGLGSTSVDEGYRDRVQACTLPEPTTSASVNISHSYQDRSGDDVPLGI
jgi:hypothetical protein